MESASATRRPTHTILGRLNEAVREQNWFAVALEVLIVIVGVVVGFQVTSWGQARQDVVREQAYLHQLLGDLSETEANTTAVDSISRENLRAGTLLQRAFYVPQGPPNDSLYAWWLKSSRTYSNRPVVGTAEAMVSSGDITMVRNDSLRSSIVSYVESIKEENRVYADINTRWAAHSDQLTRVSNRLTAIYTAMARK